MKMAGKHSSLLSNGNIYASKKFYITGPCTLKLFTVVLDSVLQ